LHKNAGGAITQRIAVVATTIRIFIGLCAVFKHHRGRPAGDSRPAVPEN
jgi:hypothetical protein